MSSTRGRKKNETLPPSRARDIQALEQRVDELEEENKTLRAALNLPPANRPALGKGPTGKDRPKQSSASLSASPPMASSSHIAQDPLPLPQSPQGLIDSPVPPPQQMHPHPQQQQHQQQQHPQHHQHQHHQQHPQQITSPPIPIPQARVMPSQSMVPSHPVYATHQVYHTTARGNIQ